MSSAKVLLGARTLLGAPGLATSSKKLLGAPGLTTRIKDATTCLMMMMMMIIIIIIIILIMKACGARRNTRQIWSKPRILGEVVKQVPSIWVRNVPSLTHLVLNP